MANKKGPSIGFGRTPMPDEAGDDLPEQGSQQPAEKPLEPPLADPVFVDSVVMYEILKRYNLMPLTPVSSFEYQLVQVIAGLEKRVRELDHGL